MYQVFRGTEEQRQYWGTGNIRKHIFHFGVTREQANLFQGNRYPTGKASFFCTSLHKIFHNTKLL